MGVFGILGRLFGKRVRECEHVELVRDVTPSSEDSCEQCIEMGDTWVNLLICGHVGCCDNSKNTHATKHHRASGHEVIQPYQPGEGWRYCYVDDAMLPEAQPLR